MKPGDLVRTVKGCIAFYNKISQQDAVEHDEIMLVITGEIEIMFQVDFIKVLRNNGIIGFVRIDGIQPI